MLHLYSLWHDKNRNLSPQSHGVLEQVDAIKIPISFSVCHGVPWITQCQWEWPTEKDQWMSSLQPMSPSVFAFPQSWVILSYWGAERHQGMVSAARRKWSVLPRRFWVFRNDQWALGALLGQANRHQWFCKNTQLAFFFPDISLCFKMKKDLLFVTSIWQCSLRNADNAD